MKTNASSSVPDVKPVEPPALDGGIGAEALMQLAATEAGQRELAGLPPIACQRIGLRISNHQLELNREFYKNLMGSNDGRTFLWQVMSYPGAVGASYKNGFQIELNDIFRLTESDDGVKLLRHAMNLSAGPVALKALRQEAARDQLLSELSKTPRGRFVLNTFDYLKMSNLCLTGGKNFSPLSQHIVNDLLSDPNGVGALGRILEAYEGAGFAKTFQADVQISAQQFSQLLDRDQPSEEMKIFPKEARKSYCQHPAYALFRALQLSTTFEELVARDARFTTEQFNRFVVATKAVNGGDDGHLVAFSRLSDRRRQQLLMSVAFTPKILLANSNLRINPPNLPELKSESDSDDEPEPDWDQDNHYAAKRFRYLLQEASGLLATNLDANYKLTNAEVAAAFRDGPVSDDARWLAALMRANCMWQVLTPQRPIEVPAARVRDAMSNMTKVQAMTGLVEAGHGQGVTILGPVGVGELKLAELLEHEDEDERDHRNARPGVRLLSALAHEGVLQLHAHIPWRDFESCFVSPGVFQGFVAAMIGSGRKAELIPMLQASPSPVFFYLAEEHRPVGAASEDEDLQAYLMTHLLSTGFNRVGQAIEFMNASGFVALAADAAQGNADSTRFIDWFLRSEDEGVVTIRRNTLGQLNAEGLSALIAFAPDLALQMLDANELNFVDDRRAFHLSRRAMEVVSTWPEPACTHLTQVQLAAMASALGAHANLLNLFAGNQPQLLERMCVLLHAISPILGAGTQHYEALTAQALDHLVSLPQARATFVESASQRQIQAIPPQAFRDVTPAALSAFSESEPFNPFLRHLTERQLLAMLAPDGQGALHRGLFTQPPVLSAALINSFHPRELANALARHGIRDISRQLYERMDANHRRELLDRNIRIHESFEPPPAKRVHANEER